MCQRLSAHKLNVESSFYMRCHFWGKEAASCEESCVEGDIVFIQQTITPTRFERGKTGKRGKLNKNLKAAW